MRGRMTRALLEGALAGLAGAVAMTAVGVGVIERAARQPRVRLGHLVELAADRPGPHGIRVLGTPSGLALRVGLGVACGIGYGVALEYAPQARGTGVVLTTAVWLAVDEWLTPLLGRSGRGGQASSADRVLAVAPQLAYALACDVCLALLRRAR